MDYAVHRQTHTVGRVPLFHPGSTERPHRRPSRRCAGTALPDGFPAVADRAETGERQELDSFNRELERTEELVQQAKDYEDAQRIRTLIKAVQKKLSTGELEYRDYFPTWAAWASEKAEWLDPTVGHRDAVLGRRHEPILQPPKLDP
ncbi:MAG: hypothetical protein Q4F20_04735 [Eubacteriales bacterium]|nr:hypothetical protein [Eubacteriales bacterium]